MASGARTLTLLGLALCALPTSDAFSFFVRPKQYSCYTEEVSSGRSIIHIDYSAGKQIADGPFNLEVISPRGVTVHSQKLERQEGAVQVKLQGTEGPHSVCVRKDGEHTTRISLTIETHTTTTGDWVEHKDPASGRTFYHNPKSKESVWELPSEMTTGLTVANVQSKGDSAKLSTTQAEMELYANYMKALQALMDQIRDEANAIIERQIRFKGTTDATSSALWYLSLAQLCLCALIPAIQTYLLKRLFISKKYV